MQRILLQGPKGQRFVDNGQRFMLQAGEFVVGKADDGMVGLGDLVAAGLKSIGIKQTKDCGCSKRQHKWNKVRLPRLF